MNSINNITDLPDGQRAAAEHDSHWSNAIRALSCGVAIVIGVQLWSSIGVVKSAGEIRQVLTNSHMVANKLRQRLGYGGLIHNFKNFLLRPEEKLYRQAAENDALAALALIDQLENSADSVGLDVSLKQTREMIRTYADQLERVQELSSQGYSRGYIDRQVRFDDQAALDEVQTVLKWIDYTVNDKLDNMQRIGVVAMMVGSVATAFVGCLFIVYIARVQRRYMKSMNELARRLSSSNEALLQANTSLSQFAGIVSHDLVSPLRHINFLNELIIEDSADPGMINGHTSQIHRTVMQLEQIIASLLDFTSTGLRQPNCEAIDFAEFFRTLELELRCELSEHGARLRFESGAGFDEPVYADPALLKRVFTNLICNSIKYARAEEPAEIVLFVRSQGEWVEYCVRDNGIGIEPRYAEKVFEPLQRLHATEDQYKGVGIGLSLVRSIVEGHGGRIWLDTDYVGTGSQIKFTLPRVEQIPSREAA